MAGVPEIQGGCRSECKFEVFCENTLNLDIEMPRVPPVIVVSEREGMKQQQQEREEAFSTG